jgi:acyl-CoA synthetase (NDP forming)
VAEAERLELPLAELEAETLRRLRHLVPAAATVANPLDYTALIRGESDALRDIVAAVGDDPGVAQVVVVYDQPADISGAPERSWAAVRDGILAGAGATGAPVTVASTLPELLDDDAAARFAAAGVPAVAGLRTGHTCAGGPGSARARLRAGPRDRRGHPARRPPRRAAPLLRRARDQGPPPPGRSAGGRGVGILLIVAGILLTRLLARRGRREARARDGSATMPGRLSQTDG